MTKTRKNKAARRARRATKGETMKKTKKVFGLPMSDALAARLAKEAKRRDCPKTAIVRAALNRYLDAAELEAAK